MIKCAHCGYTCEHKISYPKEKGNLTDMHMARDYYSFGCRICERFGICPKFKNVVKLAKNIKIGKKV